MDLSLYPPNAELVDGRLTLGGCQVADVAEEFGTPAYLVDAAGLRQRALDLDDRLSGATEGKGPRPFAKEDRNS